MQLPKSIVAVVLVGMVAVACGGTPATSGPGATQNPGGGATPGPQATQGGGGGTKPAGWDAKGKAHYELSGPASKRGDIGFFPLTSIFGGTDQTILYFATEGVEETLIVTFAAGQIAVAYVSTDLSVPGAQCTSSNLKIEASSASGSLDCANVSITPISGALMTGGRLQITFDARN